MKIELTEEQRAAIDIHFETTLIEEPAFARGRPRLPASLFVQALCNAIAGGSFASGVGWRFSESGLRARLEAVKKFTGDKGLKATGRIIRKVLSKEQLALVVSGDKIKRRPRAFGVIVQGATKTKDPAARTRSKSSRTVPP